MSLYSQASIPYGSTQDEMNAAINRFYHEKVQLDQADAAVLRTVAFANVDKIFEFMHSEDGRFSREPVRAGSYWQGLKVSEANEFDYSVVLKNIGPLIWINSEPRWYGFNKERTPAENTIPGDLLIVYCLQQLSRPPTGYTFVALGQDIVDKLCIGDLIKGASQGASRFDLIPFLVSKRLKQLLTDARTRLPLQGEVTQYRTKSGPAQTLCFTVNDTRIDVDFAPIIRAELPFQEQMGWPRPGAQWPSREKVQEIKKRGINLVAKKDFYWMLSYAELERLLVDKIDSDGGKRKEVHRIMKKLNAEVWCGPNKPVLSSYILKNIWFWEIEKYPDVECWDNDHLWERLYTMCDHLRQCCRARSLSQYFHVKLDLLNKQKNTPEETAEYHQKLDSAARNIDIFLNDPIKYIQIN